MSQEKIYPSIDNTMYNTCTLIIPENEEAIHENEQLQK